MNFAVLAADGLLLVLEIGGLIYYYLPSLETFAAQKTLIDCKELVQKSEAAMLQLENWQNFEMGLEMGLGIDLVVFGIVMGLCLDFGLGLM